MSEVSQPQSTAGLRRTPLYDVHVESGGRMVPFAGYEMPVRYGSQVEEHHAVRRHAGLFDVSHMGEVEVGGPQALDFLQRLTPNDVSRLVVGQAQYSALLDETGRFLDDLLVYRLTEGDYLLVVNAATRTSDVAWIEQQAAAFDVEVRDRSDDVALLALQGPRAVDILGDLGATVVDGLRYYRCRRGEVAGHEALVSRTGYTGEDGFELYVDPEVAADLWRRLMEAGAGHGLLPAGLGARDTLRLEAGMLLSGQDIGPDVTPIEAGVGWFVKLDKGVDCIGSEVLRRQRSEGVRRRVVGFELEGRAMARSGYELAVDGTPGRVTSGSWSPTLERSIGLALIESGEILDEVEPGAAVTAQVRRTEVPGRVVALPFYKRKR